MITPKDIFILYIIVTSDIIKINRRLIYSLIIQSIQKSIINYRGEMYNISPL